jgi:hypothetical protein
MRGLMPRARQIRGRHDATHSHTLFIRFVAGMTPLDGYVPFAESVLRTSNSTPDVAEVATFAPCPRPRARCLAPGPCHLEGAT